MKLFKNTILALTILTTLFSCEKEKEEKPPCAGPVKVAFINTRDNPVRMEMATAFDAQQNPINPLFVIELPAWGTARREYPSDVRYKISWKRNCATICNQTGFGDAVSIATCEEIYITN
jgi:hypothetical protein